MSLQTITSIAICKFIPCGADSTGSAAKPGSRSRRNLSEEAAVIEEAINTGKETTAGAEQTTNPRILNEFSDVSVTAGLSTKNERMVHEDREERKKKRTGRKEKQEKDKSAEGNRNSALAGRGLQSSVLATGAGETSEDADTIARKPIQASSVPVPSKAPIDEQETASSLEPRSPSPIFVPEDWWIEMACDFWEMDEKEVLKIVFRAPDRDVAFDKAASQNVSGELFQPIETTSSYHWGPTEPASPAVCDQTNGLPNEAHSDQNHDLTTLPCRRIGGRRLKLNIAKFGRLPTIAEEPSVPSYVCAPNKHVVEETTTVGESATQATGEANHETAEPLETPATMDNSSLPAPENTRMKSGKSKSIRKRKTTRRKQAKHSDQTPRDTCFNESSAHNLTSLGAENMKSSHKINDDERKLPRLRSTLRRKNNLVALQDVELNNNAVEGMRKQSEATRSSDMNCTNKGEVQPFQFQPGVTKVRECNPSQTWESQSTSTKTGASLPMGATPGPLVQPAYQPHPPSLPAPEKRKNPRARRLVKPSARDQRSVMDKELPHRGGEDDLRLSNVNFSGGRATSPAKQRGLQFLPRIVQQVLPSLTNPKPPSANSAKQTTFDHQKRRPNPRQQARGPKLHLPRLEGSAGCSRETTCCRLNTVPKAGKVPNIVPITSGRLHV